MWGSPQRAATDSVRLHPRNLPPTTWLYAVSQLVILLGCEPQPGVEWLVQDSGTWNLQSQGHHCWQVWMTWMLVRWQWATFLWHLLSASHCALLFTTTLGVGAVLILHRTVEEVRSWAASVSAKWCSWHLSSEVLVGFRAWVPNAVMPTSGQRMCIFNPPTWLLEPHRASGIRRWKWLRFTFYLVFFFQ